MFFDLMLIDEVRDLSGVSWGDGLPTTVDRAVDEEFDAVLDGFVD
jgi:hypothetical protein